MDIDKILNDAADSMKLVADKAINALTNVDAFSKYKDSDDKVEEMLDDAGKKVTSFIDSVSSKVDPTVQNAKKRVYDSVYDDYRKAGMPYGDTHEGFLKWTDEREDIVRERVETELGRIRNVITVGFNKAKDYIETELNKAQNPTTKGSTGSSVDPSSSDDTVEKAPKDN